MDSTPTSFLASSAPLVLTAFLCVASAASPAFAQTLRGRVIDARNETAVAGASLTLLSADSQVVARAVATDSGTFRFRAPRPAEYWVGIERIGYTKLTAGPLRLVGGATTEVTLPLEPETILVDSLAVGGHPLAADTMRILPGADAVVREFVIAGG